MYRVPMKIGTLGCLLAGAVLLCEPLAAWAQTGPDLVVAKSHSGNFTLDTNGVYTIVVSNIGATASSGQITVEDQLPNALHVVSASGTGWSCSVRDSCIICPGVSEIVDCNSAAVVTPGASAFPLTLTVKPCCFVQGQTVTNTVAVAGGGETIVTNDTASDPTIVVVPVPTLPQWALIALTVFLGLAGVAALRSRTT
jgi:uncharacterized repeat protein (TIGR01451 family)